MAVAPVGANVTLCPRCETPVVPGPPPPPMSSGVVSVRLVPQGHVQTGLRPVTLPPGIHTLGRKSAHSMASVQLDVQDFFMSKQHSQIAVIVEPAGVRVVIRDAGSSNGTFVNERRLEPMEEVALRQGDMVRLGSTLFRLDF